MVDNHRVRQRRLPTILPQFLSFVVFLLATASARAQSQPSTCYGFGSVPTAASTENGPALFTCVHAPTWPAWHLWTPGHRAPAPHPGFNPGDARALPRVQVLYRCTGFLLVPVLPSRMRTLGYVIDQPEVACAASLTS